MPDQLRPELESTFVAPQTPFERLLVTIWSQVLGIEQVGIHDNFFHLGGDSLNGVHMIARANEAGLALEPGHIMQYQTIEELAQVLAARELSDGG
jgi:microcystin synthetase protein McyA